MDESYDQFPLGVMGGAAKEFAEEYSARMEPPIEFFYIAFMTCLGGMVSGRVSIDSSASPDPRLYTLILGESADDRKSTAIKKAVSIFDEHAADIFSSRVHICDGVGSAEGLQRILKDHHNTVLVLDEFKHFVSKAAIDSSVLLQCVTSLFENNKYSTNTKHEGIELRNAHLSFLAASTIDTYNRTWVPAFTDIGFNNRLFLVPGHGERKWARPQPIPQEVTKRIARRVWDIDGFVGQFIKLKFTPEADAHHERWYAGMETSVHAKRLDGYATRFMQLIAVNEQRDTIDENVARRATTLASWQLKIRRLYDPIDADNIVARMEENIRRNLGARGAMTQRELMRATNYSKYGVECYKRAIANLVSCCDVTPTKYKDSYGRSQLSYAIHEDDLS